MKKKVLFIIVLMGFFACDDIIQVVDISNRAITVLAPTDQAVLTDTDVMFTWDAVEDADSYKLQIATPSFETAQQIVTDSLVTTTFFNRTLNSGSYEWRVRAENSGYVTTYTTQKFTIMANPVDISSEQVVLLAPADTTVFSTTDTINFSWENIVGAEQYSVQIATPNFDNALEIIKDDTITNTSYSVSNLSANSYEWRVKAINPDYETGYATLGFTVNE